MSTQILPMKLFIFILCNLIAGFLTAQDCRDHLLMQQGAQLTYNVYWPKGDTAFRTVSRLVFDVEQVKDSAGGTWSSITKRGLSNYDEIRHYERKFILQCDAKNLHIPFDFYSNDTFYLQDFYPDKAEWYKNGYLVAYTLLDDAITYIIPLVLDGIDNLPDGKKRFKQKEVIGNRPGTVCFRMPDEHQFTVRTIKRVGREMISTPAGAFACHKFCMDVDDEYMRSVTLTKYWLYFNDRAGLVKFENDHHPAQVELVGIRNTNQETFLGNW